ncbi:MAG: glycosyltransferase [Gemmataceae bacterium]|nr:glycosyltransferase [Gemmataceae bacterium]
MSDRRPGLNPVRLARLLDEAVARCRIDLRGTVVFTEAATGPYAVTPVLAALAGADRVHALTRATRYGTVAAVAALTAALARAAGVAGRVEIVTAKQPALLARADVVTNSGHVRPLDRVTVGWMKRGAVVPLMYESWEMRPGDVDLAACRERGVRVAGTNERHPNVDVFSYLGVMAVKLLLDAGVAVHRSRVLLVCDNGFAPFIRAGLEASLATVEVTPALTPDVLTGRFDAILVATKPRPEATVGRAEAELIATRAPGTVVAQYWGEIARAALGVAGVPFWPPVGPRPGHMAVLPSAVGPEPIVRLQAGGLKVAEVLLRGAPGSADWEYVDAL